MYDKNNVFAKIIRGEIPGEKNYEDDVMIVIKDIQPAAKIHLLAMPKGEYVDFADFIAKAGQEEVNHYFKIIDKIAKENGADEYRLVTNKGESAGQSVFHFHTHILAGQNNQELMDTNL